MREMAKSMVSFSWAMSLLGMKQALSMMGAADPSRPSGRPMMGGCDGVTKAATEQLDDAFKGAFRTGDNLQRGFIDLMFGVWNPMTWNPSKWPGVNSSQPGTSGCGCQQNSGGSWGPMPNVPKS